MLDVLSKTYGKAFSAEAQNLKSPQPHAPGRRRRFYLAVIFLPASHDLGTIFNTESSLQIICEQRRQRAPQRSPPTRNRLAHGTPFLRNSNDRERANGRRSDCLSAVTLPLLKRAISA
jgi:hypothetical protein